MMLKKLFKKKEQPIKRNSLREIFCAFENNGKTKVMVAEAIENYDKENVICRSCKECD